MHLLRALAILCFSFQPLWGSITQIASGVNVLNSPVVVSFAGLSPVPGFVYTNVALLFGGDFTYNQFTSPPPLVNFTVTESSPQLTAQPIFVSTSSGSTGVVVGGLTFGPFISISGFNITIQTESFLNTPTSIFANVALSYDLIPGGPVAVPEPATFPLLGAALIGLFAYARRCRP
jgi:hypothetical protein